MLWGYCDELTRRLPPSAMLEALAAVEKPDRYASAYALHASALLGQTSGETLEYIGRGLDLLDGVAEGADLRLLLLGNRFGHLANSDRFAEAEQAARQALALAEQSWTPRLSGLRLIFVDTLYQRGRWDDALAELELIAQDRGAPAQMAGLRHAYQALIAGHRDDRNEAVRQGELLAA